MRRLSYYTRTKIDLSLENYHNAGITPEQSKEIIERLFDPHGQTVNIKLYCTPTGINHNWSVTILSSNPDVIVDIVWQIQSELEYELNQRKDTPCQSK